jgi:pimeloyl-ACP methyl ester carboxylesterase
MEAQAISYASPDRSGGGGGGQAGAEPPAASPEKTVIFIGGLGDELISHTVERYADNFQAAYPSSGVNVKYFTFDQTAAAEAYIKRLGSGVRVAIVGHSWGGDTAVQIVNDLPAGRIETLLTIDPVGHGGRGMLEAVGRRAKQWIDVDAVDKRHSIDNRIAGLGGKYDKAPKPYAKTFIESMRVPESAVRAAILDYQRGDATHANR